MRATQTWQPAAHRAISSQYGHGAASRAQTAMLPTGHQYRPRQGAGEKDRAPGIPQSAPVVSPACIAYFSEGSNVPATDTCQQLKVP